MFLCLVHAYIALITNNYFFSVVTGFNWSHVVSAAELVSKVQVKQSQTIHEYNNIQCMFVHVHTYVPMYTNYDHDGGGPGNNSHSDVNNIEPSIIYLAQLKQ